MRSRVRSPKRAARPGRWGLRGVLAACAALAAYAALAGCAGVAEEEDPRFRPPPDALVGGGQDAGVGGVSTARLLFFQVGADGYVAEASGASPRIICENATPVPDLEGGRVLCRPDQADQPLRLYDVTNDLELVDFPAWRASALGPPRLSPEGSRVAFKAEAEDLSTVIRVMDDNGVLVADGRGFELLGFAREDVVILDTNFPSVWRIGSDPVPVMGGRPRATGPDPAGLVYEVISNTDKVFFHDADTGRARELAEGILADVLGKRVLVIQNDPAPDRVGLKRALLLDLADGAFEAFAPLPSVPFDRTLSVRLMGPQAFVVELASVTPCPGGSVLTPTRTTWYSTLRDEVFEVDDTGGLPHKAQVDLRGEKALILDVDACGNPSGSGRVKNLRTGEVLRLGEVFQGAFSAATLSPDGRFVALAGVEGVTVVDLATTPPTTRLAGAGAPGGTVLEFR